MKLGLQIAAISLGGLVFMGLLLFLPAGTFAYWQAWAFIATFAVISFVPTIYWTVRRPEVARRRMHAGPTAETRPAQKIAYVGVYLAFSAMAIVSALDHRFGWSNVPISVTLIGLVFVAVGLGISMLVVQQNSYAAATITVEADQELVTTGLYGFVRHPMYFGAVIMTVGTPLALDSYWGLVPVIPALIMLVIRILDEEKALTDELAGYREYTQKVQSRLLPHVW